MTKPQRAGHFPAVADEPEFEAVYRANVGLIWRSLRRAGVPSSMLEDATQEVFLIHHRRGDEFRGQSSVRTWLLGIARGVAANLRRGQQRFVRRLASQRDEPAPEHIDPERIAEQAEARALVETFLRTLSPDQREVFELIEIEGLKQREVASLTGASINTVGSRLRLARASFLEFVATLETRSAAHG